MSKDLLKKINGHGAIHLVPSEIRGMYFLRLAICSRYTEEKDIDFSWQEIRAQADLTLAEAKSNGHCDPVAENKAWLYKIWLLFVLGIASGCVC